MGKDTFSHARTGVILECLLVLYGKDCYNSRLVLIIVVCISEIVVVNILKWGHTVATRKIYDFLVQDPYKVKTSLCLVVVVVFVVAVLLIIRCQRSSNVNPSMLLINSSF